MKRGCLTALMALAVVCAAIYAWDSYTSRPVALYERWFGEALPADVSELKGLSQFALAESDNWLSFITSQKRIDTITSRLGMERVRAIHGWHGPDAMKRVIVGGKEYHTDWFDRDFRRFPEHMNEIQMYWKGYDASAPLSGGDALYFVPSTGQAYYTSISASMMR